MSSDKKRGSKNSRLRQFATESLLIVFSVLFALFLNQWRGPVNENNRTTLLLANLVEEIKQNQSVIDPLLPYHETIIENLEVALQNESIESYFFSGPTPDFFKIIPNGIIQEPVSDIAWKVAQQDRISTRINFEKSKALFNVYSQQQIVYNTIQRIVELVTGREMLRKELLDESLLVFLGDMNELLGQERVLSNYYHDALDLLNE